MKKLHAFLDNLAQTYVQESLGENTTENKRHFLQQLSQMLEPFYREKGNVFYDKNDIDAFCNFMHELHEDAEYMTNWREQLGDILQNALSWREKPAQDTQALYFFWDMLKELEGKKGISLLKDNTLSELTERLLQENSPCHILVMPPHTKNPYEGKESIATFKDTYETQNMTLPAFAKIQYATHKLQVLTWIKNHRQPLVMNKSNKHGLDGKGAHKLNKGDTVSVLYCSTIEEAQKLLDDAIGDKRLLERNLFNYDEKVGKFIAFFDEGDTPQNQYHAFHFETEADAIKKIPNEIMKELKEKYDL